MQAARSPSELEGIFRQMMGDAYLRAELSQPLAKAMQVAAGIGMLDVEEEVSDSGVNLAQGFDPVMGFDAAIEALAAKLPIPTSAWDSLGENAQDWAFTVAGIMQADVLYEIQKEVKSSLEGDRTFGEFKDNFAAIYEKKGISPLKPWRVQLVHNQNITNSYQAGRYERSSDPEFQRVAPFRVYKHGGANDPRPHHVALDGFVARADDPVWDTIYPPNGFNCSCRVFHRTQGQMDRQGLILSDPLPGGPGGYTVKTPDGPLPIPVAETGFNKAPGKVGTSAEALDQAKKKLPPWMVDEVLNAVGGVKSAKKKKAKTKIAPVKPKPASAKSVAPKAAEIKPKTKKFAFPGDLDNGLEFVKNLGGSTGAELVKDKKTGQLYVRKKGANEGHLREEFAADELYRSMGVSVPKGKLYETENGPVKLTEFIEGRSLGELKGADREKAVKELKKDFAADALLGNWDVAGASLDNVIVDSKGKVFRIDNGGALRYRAQGELKGDNWNGITLELWTMREQNPSLFGGISIDEVVLQTSEIGKNKAKALKLIKDPELKEVLEKRFSSFDVYQKSVKALTAKGKSATDADALIRKVMEQKVADFKSGALKSPNPTKTATAKVKTKKASKAKKAVWGDGTHDIDFDTKKYADATGVSETEALARFKAISGFTGSDYVSIRESQRSGNDSDQAILIEKYLATAKPYKGEVYRGMALSSEELFYKVINGDGVGAEFVESSMNSWSTEKKVSEGFATVGNKKPIAVLFKVENKSGSSILNVSLFDNEMEVLAPKNRKYRVKEIMKSDNSKAGFIRIEGSVRFDVTLEEVTEK